MSYDSSNLTTPDIKWLGVRPSDLDRLNIPQQCRLPMTDEDMRTGRKLVRSKCKATIRQARKDPEIISGNQADDSIWSTNLKHQRRSRGCRSATAELLDG